MTKTLTKIHYLKSPLNYIGGKYRILPQILPLFPKRISTFVDVFCGGCDVSVNIQPYLDSTISKSTQAKSILCNDNLCFLMDLYRFLQSNPLQSTLHSLQDIINTYKLTKQNAQGYYALREDYNTDKAPLLLLTLIAFSFNHQIRFNNAHRFNTPFGKDRSSLNATMQNNLIAFIQALQNKNIAFFSLDFRDMFALLLGSDNKPLRQESLQYPKHVSLDSLKLDSQSFVYADPPYLLTQGTYNDGKRGFSGWNESLECALLESLDRLDSKGLRFALSNVLYHKGRTNTLLEQWAKARGYHVHCINTHYTNASYHAKHRDKTLTKEVLITNYMPFVDSRI
ncbi:DNA adenine methylase [uncultured Helicobacter sp.]|uniref:DNA adenine methylase n=1 Tax=uncultured Helicobacter sp. TaxID=175537 RepID=UPI00374F132E